MFIFSFHFPYFSFFLSLATTTRFAVSGSPLHELRPSASSSNLSSFMTDAMSVQEAPDPSIFGRLVLYLLVLLLMGLVSSSTSTHTNATICSNRRRVRWRMRCGDGEGRECRTKVRQQRLLACLWLVASLAWTTKSLNWTSGLLLEPPVSWLNLWYGRVKQ